MKPEALRLGEEAADWITRAGYGGSLSAFAVGVHDIEGSIDQLKLSLLPGLQRLDPKSCDEALGIVIEMSSHFDHIRMHAEDAIGCLTEVRKYFERQ